MKSKYELEIENLQYFKFISIICYINKYMYFYYKKLAKNSCNFNYLLKSRFYSDYELSNYLNFPIIS